MLRRTDVTVLDEASAGPFSMPFTEAFEASPIQVAVIGRLMAVGVGMAGAQVLPADFTLRGGLSGTIQIRIVGATPTEVQAQVLSNTLGSGETSRLSALARG